MKGISYVTDDNNKKIAVQIDINVLTEYEEWIEDLMDGLIAESRKGEETTSLDDVVAELKAQGRLH